MTLSKGQQQQSRRTGGGASGLASRKTAAPKQTKRKSDASERSSPRLHLTKQKKPASAARHAGDGSKRRASNHQQRRGKAHVSASAAGTRGTSGKGPRDGPSGGRAKNVVSRDRPAKKEDEGAKAIEALKGELREAIQSAIGTAEAECEAMVAAALDSSSAGVSGREQDDEAAEAAQRDIESNQASLVAKCSMMLKALESNRTSLSGIEQRGTAALDNLLRVESRKLKTSLDRATGARN